MTILEIFSKINAHQIEGIMTHAQLADYFDFLNLHGYKRLHEYHYLEESACMRKTHRYFLNHFNMLIEDQAVNDPNVIPIGWKNRTRFDVDSTTRKKSVLSAFEKWRTWETETKHLYEQMYKEACDINEVAAALFIKELVHDVDMELKCAERMLLRIKAVDYDMSFICEEQDELHEHFKEKTKEVGKILC